MNTLPREKADEGRSSLHRTPQSCPHTPQMICCCRRGTDRTTGAWGRPGQPALDGRGAGVGWGLLRDHGDRRGADRLTRSEHTLMFLLLYWREGRKACRRPFGFFPQTAPSSVPGCPGLSSSTAICTTSARSCSDIIQDVSRVAGGWEGIRLT